MDQAQQRTFWYTTRRPSDRKGDAGTEVYLSLVDLDFKPSRPAADTLTVHVTCTNRDLPARLPFGGERGLLELEGAAPLSRILCLTKPTSVARPRMGRGAQWRLISHLSLNYLSLVDGGRQALQENLQLYALSGSPVGRHLVAGPGEGVVRFPAHNTLTFPPSSIDDLSRSDEGTPASMVVAFMGLTGPSGVLPRHYTELVLEEERRRERGLAAFFDVFNHRAVSLFYRAWQKYRVPIAHEQANRPGAAPDPFSESLYAHFGMSTPGLRGRLAVDDQSFVFYSGLLSQQPRSASALEGMIADYFAVPAKVGQFVGEWLPLAEDNRSRLGRAGRPGEDDRGAHNVLGRTAVAGKRFWDQQAGFRLRLGPMDFEQFSELLPSGPRFRVLAQLARFFVGQGLDFDVQLVLKAEDVPACRLGDRGPRAPASAGPPGSREERRRGASPRPRSAAA